MRQSMEALERISLLRACAVRTWKFGTLFRFCRVSESYLFRMGYRALDSSGDAFSGCALKTKN